MKLSPATPDTIARKIHSIISNNNPPLRVPVTIDAYFFGLMRKCFPRRLYHLVMYYLLPKVFRWGEDDLPIDSSIESRWLQIEAPQ